MILSSEELFQNGRTLKILLSTGLHIGSKLLMVQRMSLLMIFFSDFQPLLNHSDIYCGGVQFVVLTSDQLGPFFSFLLPFASCGLVW